MIFVPKIYACCISMNIIALMSCCVKAKGIMYGIYSPLGLGARNKGYRLHTYDFGQNARGISDFLKKSRPDWVVHIYNPICNCAGGNGYFLNNWHSVACRADIYFVPWVLPMAIIIKPAGLGCKK